MKTRVYLTSVAVLALAVAACGASSDADEGAETPDAVEEVVTADPIDDGSETAGEDAGDTAATDADDADDAADEAPAAAAAPAEKAPTAEAPKADAAPAPAVAAAAQPAAFAVCKACHAVEAGKNGVGPSLAGVFGRKAGIVAGFAYSPAMKNSGLTWDEATLDKYLAAPTRVVPGGKMPLGAPAPAARKAVIEYLKTI